MKIKLGDISDSVFCTGMACALDLPPMAHSPAPPKERGEKTFDVDVFSFPQEHVKTDGGPISVIRGQTTVVMCGESAAVYFGRTLAYAIVKFNAAFVVDLQLHNMASVEESRRYVEAAPVHQLHAV